MTLPITFTPVVQAPPPVEPGVKLYQLRGYGDEVMIRLMGLSTVIINTGNFQNVSLFTETPGYGFGAVSTLQRIDDAAITWMKSIQPVDSYTTKQKMNWLGIDGYVAGRPYIFKNGINNWGPIGWGYQWMQFEISNGAPREYVFKGKYQSEPGNAPLHDITFFKPIFLRRSDIGRPVAELLREGKLQYATEAFYPDDHYNDKPRGRILCPVWSPEDWRVSGGGGLCMAKEFVFPAGQA